MFAAIAASYDLNNRLHSFGRDQAWRRKAVQLCQIKPDDHVLDVACGTGDLTEAFADARPASVMGVDFTAAMLDLACAKRERRARGDGVPRPEYQLGDAMKLSFADQAFNVVSIAFGLRNLADPVAAISEFRRVLRPGGRLVILEFSRPRQRLWRWVTETYTTRIMPITATLLARDRSGAYRYLPRSVETFLDGEAITAALEAAGFSNVTTHPMTFGICAAHIGIVE
jgi:demethylmenaquinone methyltransferase/2-methoxy-6-polyprenyl-1,4-benzoquinol methylase